MVGRSTVMRDSVVGIRDEHKQAYVLTASGEKYYFADYHMVFSSIDIDELWGENTLPYTGRMMIPLLIPGLAHAFPEGAESLHYSSCEFQTRVTEMKVITRHDSPDTLILIEVPVLPGAAESFPRNTIDYALEHNLFAEKAYPQQSEQAFATYHAYVERGAKIPNLRYVGRHAEFKYWGMPETVYSAYKKTPRLRTRLMEHGQVLPSTTSHKREPLVPTLEVFAQLGLHDLDLNLHHILEVGVPLDQVRSTLAAGRQRALVVSGGWCDFFHQAPQIDDTFKSVARQVAIHGRWAPIDCGCSSASSRARNILPTRSLSSSTTFAGCLGTTRICCSCSRIMTARRCDPGVCREIAETVSRPNIRVNFDPINFERAGVRSLDAFGALQPYIGR